MTHELFVQHAAYNFEGEGLKYAIEAVNIVFSKACQTFPIKEYKIHLRKPSLEPYEELINWGETKLYFSATIRKHFERVYTKQERTYTPNMKTEIAQAIKNAADISQEAQRIAFRIHCDKIWHDICAKSSLILVVSSGQSYFDRWNWENIASNWLVKLEDQENLPFEICENLSDIGEILKHASQPRSLLVRNNQSASTDEIAATLTTKTVKNLVDILTKNGCHIILRLDKREDAEAVQERLSSNEFLYSPRIVEVDSEAMGVAALAEVRDIMYDEKETP